MGRIGKRLLGVMVAVVVVVLPAATGAQPALTPAQIEQFLLAAEVVSEQPAGKGVTNSSRLTLSDGVTTHDAHFQAVDDRRELARLGNGRTEVSFADSYHFNIAAYRLATALGLDHMVPVSVERRWRGDRGALSWWVDAAWDETSRIEQGVRPPDVQRWIRQLSDMQMVAELFYDTDQNHGNLLYTADWDLWLIDFTRAFRPWYEPPNLATLTQCRRTVFERLQALTLAGVEELVGDHLTMVEARAVIERRDRIVAHFEALIAERGEDRVLYDVLTDAVLGGSTVATR